MSGNPATAAHIAVTITVQAGSQTLGWEDPDVAQLLNYPTWYFVRLVPNANAPYLKSQPNYSKVVQYVPPSNVNVSQFPAP